MWILFPVLSFFLSFFAPNFPRFVFVFPALIITRRSVINDPAQCYFKPRRGLRERTRSHTPAPVTVYYFYYHWQRVVEMPSIASLGWRRRRPRIKKRPFFKCSHPVTCSDGPGLGAAHLPLITHTHRVMWSGGHQSSSTATSLRGASSTAISITYL